LRAVVEDHGKVPAFSKTQRPPMNSGVIFSISRLLATWSPAASILHRLWIEGQTFRVERHYARCDVGEHEHELLLQRSTEKHRAEPAEAC
jgi:hypothetical protein